MMLRQQLLQPNKNQNTELNMNSTDLYSTVLTNLSNLRGFMISQAWIDDVSQSAPDVKKQAFNISFDVMHAINILSNQALSDIADEMAEQSDDIIAATKSLNKSVQQFTSVSNVLDSIANLLGAIGQVVSLA